MSYQDNICRVDTNYADPEFELCPMPTVEDEEEDTFDPIWELDDDGKWSLTTC